MTAPTAFRAEAPPPNGESFPAASIVEYEFPATEFSGGPFKLTWYDGGKKPDAKLIPGVDKLPDNGSFVIGDNGVMYGHRLYPLEKFKDFKYPDAAGDDHYTQWTRAIQGQAKTLAPIAGFAAPLTEAVVLGNVGLQFPGTRLEWDAQSLRITNEEKANAFLRRDYREGWRVEGLG
jgi:hypothetical protein